VLTCPICEEDDALNLESEDSTGKLIRCETCGHTWLRAHTPPNNPERTMPLPRGVAAKASPDENRADPNKIRLMKKLQGTGLLRAVVQANCVYLHTVMTSPATREREYWALSCMPTTTRGRLSAVSMLTMEVFVLHDQGDAEPDAFVIVRDEFGDLPGVMCEPSTYRDGGSSQWRLSGTALDVEAALERDDVGASARDLASNLMARGKTLQWRGHHFGLADLALGREALPILYTP
jgi:hypothetical protein